jgi:hypothetical protein
MNVSSLGKKKPRLRRDWTLARSKCDAEGGCRNCGFPRVEAAHIIGREHDSKPPLRGGVFAHPGYVVNPDRIIPLCRECHQGPQGQHAGRLDLLPLLTLDEQLQAVADAGSITQALAKLSPEHNPRRVA